MCGREDPRDLDDGDEDDEFTEELDEDDYDFFSRIDGAIDRLQAFSLQSSAEIEDPCADDYRCSDESGIRRCTPITGTLNQIEAQSYHNRCVELYNNYY